MGLVGCLWICCWSGRSLSPTQFDLLVIGRRCSFLSTVLQVGPVLNAFLIIFLVASICKIGINVHMSGLLL